MADTEVQEQETESAPLSWSRLIAAALDFAGGAVMLLSLAWAVSAFWELSQTEDRPISALLRTAALLFVGLGAGLLHWAAGEVLRKLKQFSVSVEESRTSQPAVREGPERLPLRRPAPSAAANDVLTRQLITLMREMRDISLLTETQRAERMQIQAQDLVRQLEHDVPELLREHNWFEAFQRVQTARERFPTFDAWDKLERQIEAVREQVEARDIEAATRQADELATLGAWDRVGEVIRDLMARHPRAPSAVELTRRLKKQRDRAEAEVRAKIMAKAQEHADKRDWAEALSHAQSLLRRFPKSTEADALRLQLPTLEANAGIKIRQQMESDIRDLLKHKRFADAVDLARDLIERYPNSPQAEILRDQLPKLEEKAAAAGRWA